MTVSEVIKYFRRVLRLLRDLSDKTGYSLFRHVVDYIWSAIRHGTLIRQYTKGRFWRKSDMERQKCLTYLRMVRYMNRYNDKSYIQYLNEKPKFNAFFSEFVTRDWLYVPEADEERFKSFLELHRSFIAKPGAGVEGRGIRKLLSDDYKDIQSLYNDLKADDVLIEECIIQHPHMVFGNSSVNTVRTMTILDKAGKGHVVKAILRVGIGDSVVDNYAQGGSIYEVDVQSGVVVSFGQSKEGETHMIHPGTDIMMLGYQIPMWKLVIDISERAAEYIPQVKIIGWDVAIMQNGVQLIEGNHNPDYELYEFVGSSGYNEVFRSLL